MRYGQQSSFGVRRQVSAPLLPHHPTFRFHCRNMKGHWLPPIPFRNQYSTVYVVSVLKHVLFDMLCLTLIGHIYVNKHNFCVIIFLHLIHYKPLSNNAQRCTFFFMTSSLSIHFQKQKRSNRKSRMQNQNWHTVSRDPFLLFS